jgi:hypothetical protein
MSVVIEIFEDAVRRVRVSAEALGVLLASLGAFEWHVKASVVAEIILPL